MRLSLHVLGTEVLAISTEPEAGEAGDATSNVVGLTASHGDARWEKMAEFE